MLQILRENTGNWIIKIFLAIIVIVFVFLGVGSMTSGQNDSIGSIDDEPITIKEYKKSYDYLVRQIQGNSRQPITPELLEIFNIKQQALNLLIENRLLIKQADDLKIHVTDKELQENLLSIPEFQVAGQFDFDQYKRVLQYLGMSPETFEKEQIDQLRRQKVRQVILGTVTVTKNEARDWYVYDNTKMAVDYLKFVPSSYKEINPDDAAIKAYYKKNKDSYKSVPKVKAAYLKFSAQDYASSVSVSDDTIKEYYEDRIETFKIPEQVQASHILILTNENASEEVVAQAKKRADDVYQKAIKGEDFATLAKKYSEGPSSVDGGKLGKFSKESMVKPFADKAFSMKAGEIGTPIRTQFGWHVIKVSARFDASTKSLAQVSGDIKKLLIKEKMISQAEDKAEEAFDSIDQGDSLEQVAVIAKKKIQTTKPFTLSGNTLTMLGRETFAKAAFDIQAGDVGEVQLIGDSFYLINVLEKIEPKIQPLEVVKSKVRKDLIATLQDEKAKTDAQTLLDSRKELQTLGQLAAKQNLTIKTTSLFTREGAIEKIGNLPSFNQASFTLNENKKIYPELIETRSGYYLIGFNRMQAPTESEISDNLKATITDITGKKQMQTYQTWLAEVKKQHHITYDPAILK